SVVPIVFTAVELRPQRSSHQRDGAITLLRCPGSVIVSRPNSPMGHPMASSWIRALFARRAPFRRPRTFRTSLHLDSLEDRNLPATFTEAASSLALTLANEDLTVVSLATGYELTLGGGNKWSGTDSLNVVGNGTALLTITPAGISAFGSGITLDD